MIGKNPLLSVRLMTYNFEKFIKNAMEGIYSQETNFSFEVVVGDDFSTDKTLELIRQYSDTDKIKLRILNRQMGDRYWIERNKKGRLYNFIDIINHCEGKYIALLDGDDYWTDTKKLQRQVDFLESHPEFSFCFHNAYVYDEDAGKEYLFNNDKGVFFKKYLNCDRVVEGWELLNRWICPTASIVFRNNYPIDAGLFEKTKYGDIVLILSLARQGKVYYFNQVSSVYRRLLSGQRKVYSDDVPGVISHTELLLNTFKDIPYLETVCSKRLSIFTYSYSITQLRKKSIKEFKDYIKLFKIYFIKTLKLKSPVNKLLFLLFILHKNLRITAKAALNYKI
jgi:glycosyltransferase involved in cell wall biosynthesis